MGKQLRTLVVAALATGTFFPRVLFADDVVQCFPGDPVFPSFDMSCQSDDDCAVAVHQINCCGTRQALGINGQEVGRFSEDEAICELQYPSCDCADFGIRADDGQSTYDPDELGVVCAENTCTTFVAPK